MPAPAAPALLVVNRYRVAEADAVAFRERARPALDAFAARPGFLDGQVARCTDDPAAWVMVTRWAGVGDYRRALSAYDVKLHAVPLMYEAVDEPGAHEVLLAHDGAASVQADSDRAADGPAGPGSLGAPPDPLE